MFLKKINILFCKKLILKIPPGYLRVCSLYQTGKVFLIFYEEKDKFANCNKKEKS